MACTVGRSVALAAAACSMVETAAPIVVDTVAEDSTVDNTADIAVGIAAGMAVQVVVETVEQVSGGSVV